MSDASNSLDNVGASGDSGRELTQNVLGLWDGVVLDIASVASGADDCG